MTDGKIDDECTGMNSSPLYNILHGPVMINSIILSISTVVMNYYDY